MKKDKRIEKENLTELDNLVKYLEKYRILVPHTNDALFSCEKLLDEIKLLKDPDKSEKQIEVFSFEEAYEKSLSGAGELYNKFGDTLYGSHLTGKIQCKPAQDSTIVYLSTLWSYDKSIVEGDENHD